MKRTVLRIDFQKYLLFTAAGICFTCIMAKAQLTLTGLQANFGIDGDTRAGNMKFGARPNAATTDDWFSFSSQTRGVIDTTSTAYYKTLLQNKKNISFLKSMSTPLFSKIDGRLWLDGIYLRDFTSVNAKDSTAFGTAAKNGTNPMTWDGRPSNVPKKTDIVDAYAHFRRNGGIKDSLWLFTGVSTVGTDGDRYFDIELFKNATTYNKYTGSFIATGLSDGHTEWIFDPFGNIIQTGDMIISVTYSPGQAPVIDLRIWVSKLTYKTAKPSLMKFGKEFDGGLLYGYANVLTPNNLTSFGSGSGNFSNSNSDSTFATPWGTVNTSGDWSKNYDQLQFVEISLNLTKMGIDASLYGDLTHCDRIFHSLFFKSRSSSSFTANLQDFAGPINFAVPGLDFLVNGTGKDTLTCDNPMGELSIMKTSSAVGSYEWKTLDGNIVSMSTDSAEIQVNKKGIYLLSAKLAAGCPVIRNEVFTVDLDDLPPVATADITLTPDGAVQLLGGDPVASNVLTPFGRSKGLEWNWKGPNGFNATEQNPVINGDWIWGAYYLELKELRNGCKSMASMDVSFRTSRSGELLSALALEQKMYLRNSGNKLSLVANQENASNGVVTVYTAAGQLLMKKQVQLMKGENTIDLQLAPSKQLRIISVYTNNKLTYVRKMVY
jgi:hypothetical protein